MLRINNTVILNLFQNLMMYIKVIKVWKGDVKKVKSQRTITRHSELVSESHQTLKTIN